MSSGHLEDKEECNKAIKYLKKAVSKLKSLSLPSTSTQSLCKPQCFAICIDNLGPIQIPTFYIPQNVSNGKVEISIYCSIFDSNDLCFIGRTWTSNPFTINRNNEAISIQKFWIYLKSIPYESKWIVMELVAQTRNEGVIISQISLGWNVIKLFTNTRALIDVHPDENNNDPLQRESKLKSNFLFQGSPTYLLINNDINSIPETGIKISYRLFTFKKLINISHLLSSETIIGSNNIIPGLGHTLKIPSTPFHKSWHILFDIKPIDFIISSPILTLPDGFEPEILEKLTKIRKNNFCGSNETVANIIDRHLNISFCNGRNIITTPTIIQLQQNSVNTNILSWNGDIKIRVNANLQHNCWLLISLNHRIEWKDDPSSPQSPAYYHTVCLGRELINITSDQLILNGSQPTKLILSPQYSWIDDCAIFNNINNNIETDKKQMIGASIIIQLASTTNINETTNRMINTTITESASHSTQISSKSTTSKSVAPKLSLMHHVQSFGWKDRGVSVASIPSPPKSDPEAVIRVSNNPLSIKSNISAANTMPIASNRSNILPSPHGYINTPQGMVAMNWDDIKKQSLMMIPSNVLQNKIDSASKLGMLQESFAVNTWQKLQGQTYPNAKILKQSQSIRSLRGGYTAFDVSPYDIIPNRKVIDIEYELSKSHKRTFSINCNAFNIKAKHLLLNPIQSIMIQLDFMGEKVISDPILISSNTTINNLRESLMTEDKYESLPFIEPYQFEFHILPNQIRQFIHFLNEKYAIFTVWNANTMFQIGSSRICLRDFLLQNCCNQENKIKENIEIPISSTKINNESLSMIETQPNISVNTTTINGKLCIQIMHEAIDLSDTAKIQYASWSEKLITNICDENGEFCVRNLKLMHSKNRRIRAEALYKNPHCTQKLQTLPNQSNNNLYERKSYPTQSIKTKWKIPIEAIHEISNHGNNCNHEYVHDDEWKVRKGNIETMDDFRCRKKQEMLNRLSESDQFIIQPAMGQIIFFEIEFCNPWNQRKKFYLEINDKNKELKLVTNIKEICYLKEKYNVSTTMKRHLFEKENVNEIIVNPQETVYIPFKFESFAFGSEQNKNALFPKMQKQENDEKDNDDDDENKLIQKRRIINIAIYNIDDDDNYHFDQNKENNELSLIEFNICVEPIKFSIDRIFDIFAFENSKFVGNLPLPSIKNIHTTHDEHILSVQCSSNNIPFEFDKNNENITFRCDVKKFPKRNKFYFIIYNDRYCIDINEIWEINIYPYFNENCHGMLGGIIKNDIHLPSLINNINTDKVKFYCDQQNGIELKLINNDNKNILNIQYAPPEIGKKLMRIHCVDNVDDYILYQCLLLIHIEMPRINNSFIIHIESNDNEDIITRKLPYNNGYNQDRNYELISNDPSIIRVTNPILQIPSESTMEFILEVMPKNMMTHSKEILLFVTECGNLEQCLRIEVKKGKLTNL